MGVELVQPEGGRSLELHEGDDLLAPLGIGSADDLTSAMRSHKPGDKVTVTFLRGQSRQSVDVQLVSRQASN